MLLVIDNYDSFTFNVVQYLAELGATVKVVKNDELTMDQLEQLKPRQIVISPGPGSPNDAGISLAAIAAFAGRIPILGICLGHQCIAQAFGGGVVRTKRVMHGKTSEINHVGEGLFGGIPSPFVATRYHSLVVEASRLPSSIKVTAWTQGDAVELDEIMALAHAKLPIVGVQFHPESILSEHGHRLLHNFLTL